jgi:hypothetical protein
MTLESEANHSVLDGGGVRGLSSIETIKEMMRRFNEGRSGDGILQPWEVFEMIAGMGSGG